MKAMHFICAREDGLSLKGLAFDKATRSYRSGQWDITPEEAQALVGGWIYLHPSKAGRAEFGGVVEAWEPVRDETLARSDRIVLILRKRPEATGQRWRGRKHDMAHCGGLVEADSPHELRG